MKWKIVYSESSRSDLNTIFFYISEELAVPKAAENQIERILKAVRSLEEMPMRHQVYHEEPWKTKSIRFFPVDNFIVFYLPDEGSNTVNILRIIYAGRNMKEAYRN
jgi:toxin ParE1/3/4